jgi:hypothetical protein
MAQRIKDKTATKRKRSIFWVLTGVLVLTASLNIALAQKSKAPAPKPCVTFDKEYTEWGKILKHRVKNGQVDYAGIKANDLPTLNRYLDGVATVCYKKFKRWSKPEKLAFWINTYNAYTVKLVLDHYPIKSIRKIGLFPGAAWRERIVDAKTIKIKKISLSALENDIIRRVFGEPRIHFALVCASNGCPILRSEPYVAEKLEMQLEQQTRSFMKNRTNNRYDASTKTLHLSKIFDWYKADFGKDKAARIRYAANYMDDVPAAKGDAASISIAYLPYDWALNGK